MNETIELEILSGYQTGNSVGDTHGDVTSEGRIDNLPAIRFHGES